jgi:DNA-binding NarL/FixJ family response regulator
MPTSGWTLLRARPTVSFVATKLVEGRVPGESRRVVILYDHPLLGEGLERLLRDRTGLEVALVHVDGIDAARTALATKPDVVILERCAPVQAIDLLRLAPDALFIDVGLDAGPSWSYRRDELSTQPEDILRTIAERVAPAPR